MTPFRFSRAGALFLIVALALPAAFFLNRPASADEDGAEAVTIPWMMDMTKAKAKAKAEGKDLLINFTGSDWCGWCKKLEGEVFHHKAFLDVATKKYVMVYLDFPQAEDLKAKVVDAKLNAELQGAYGVGGFPSIILTNAAGEPYGKTGYKEGGPAGYLKHIQEIRDETKGLVDLLAAGKKASVDQIKAGVKGLLATEYAAFPSYGWIVDRAKAADPANWLGAKKTFLGIEAGKKLEAMLPQSAGVAPDWEKIATFLVSEENLRGETYVNISYGCAKYLLEEADKPAEAKQVLERTKRDTLYNENPGAKKAIDALIVRCDESIAMNAEEAADAAK